MNEELLNKLRPCQLEFFESPTIFPLTKEAWAYYMDGEGDMPEDAITIDLGCDCTGLRLWSRMSELDNGKISQKYKNTLLPSLLNYCKTKCRCYHGEAAGGCPDDNNNI